ncbi:MAG: hypothetical protein QME47_08070, partial [Candidatus Thermoplasmatota archaeon]|nr:hypothetical protein [Candidatus Thermoplasmatota archaeon]
LKQMQKNMQKLKEVKRVEIVYYKEKGVLTIVDLDQHGRAVDRILKILPLSANVQFCSPCG